MYIIIVGAGDIGTPLIDIATQSGNEVVVIERDETRANRAADEFDCLVLHDDATTKDTLDDAGAVFESMSGFTGTGLTMTDNEEVLPRTLQWWRTFSEWVGGVGVIVLTTAILSRPGSGSLTLYESEARSKKIHPSIVSTVRTIWWIFILFTFLSILALWLAGMPIWGAINHGMTGLATGGFSITDNSIATYDSVAIDFVLLPVMLLGSIAFPVHYLILQGDLRNFYSDLQTRWVFGYMGIGQRCCGDSSISLAPMKRRSLPSGTACSSSSRLLPVPASRRLSTPRTLRSGSGRRTPSSRSHSGCSSAEQLGPPPAVLSSSVG